MMSLRHQLGPQRLAAVLKLPATSKASHQGSRRARPAKITQASSQTSNAGRGHVEASHFFVMSFEMYPSYIGAKTPQCRQGLVGVLHFVRDTPLWWGMRVVNSS